MVERNKLCLCGSGLKYKKCYDLKLETCSLYQKDVYKALNAANDGKEKDVLTFFEEVGQEIKSVFAKDQNSREVVSIRVQAIAIFTLVDVLASYWFCYLDATEKQSVRFKSWIG